MDSTSRRKRRGEQIARRLEQLADGQPSTQADVRRAVERGAEAYESAAAAHDAAARKHDARAADLEGGDAANHEAAAAWHRAGRDADTAAGAAARAQKGGPDHSEE
jgi:hypothetical protein